MNSSRKKRNTERRNRKMKNLIYIDQDFGWFIGNFDRNQRHKHYAIQLSIPIGSPLTIQSSKGKIITELPILIQPNITHQITSKTNHFLVLLNPASTIGHFWKKSTDSGIGEFEGSPATDLQKILNTGNRARLNPVDLKMEINKLLKSYDCHCGTLLHHSDERINKALSFLKENATRVVPLEEIADNFHMSPSRFRHLFKEQTGITYRRSQLWTRLILAIQSLGTQTLTKIAYSAGFSDSAHFSRTFKENFGFSPQEFLKISQFIQA